MQKAGSFAARVRKEAGEDPVLQVKTGWITALGRPPAADELDTALDYLTRNSLSLLCLMLFNTNEFVYVD